MVIHRFLVSQRLCTGEGVSLPPPVARQCFRVLKLRVGERVALFDGTGLEVRVRLTEVSSEGVEGIVESCDTPPVEPPEPLEVVAAMPRQEKWEWILQKGTELGVTCFQPLETARCVARITDRDWPRKAERWQKIIVEAVEQSGRTRLPELRKPITLQALVQVQKNEPAFVAPKPSPPMSKTRLLASLEAGGLGWGPATNISSELPEGASSHPPAGIVLHTGRGLPSLREALLERRSCPDAGTLRLLTGPEGGLEDAEVELLKAAGWIGAALGPRILRCETAVVAACAIIMGCQ